MPVPAPSARSETKSQGKGGRRLVGAFDAASGEIMQSEGEVATILKGHASKVGGNDLRL